MARHLLRNLAISGAAALSFATVTSPNTDEALSNQRNGSEAATQAEITRLTAEARSLNREYNEISFQERSLQTAQQSLANPQGDVAAQVRALEELNAALQTRIIARNERVTTFHDELLTNRSISEADAHYLYTNPFDGEYYAYYYTQKMAYRDECNSDTSCMERMDNTETSRKVKDYSLRAGGTFGGTLAGLFGLSALGGAAGNWRRRRAEKQHRDRVADTRDMLTPRQK